MTYTYCYTFYICRMINRIPLYLYTLFLVFTLASCGENEAPIEIPANILPKEKMVQVLTDVHLAEADASLRTLPDSTSKTPISFQKIFDKDSITKQQYEESLAFYVDHPVLLDSIYVQVLNELSKRQAGE